MGLIDDPAACREAARACSIVPSVAWISPHMRRGTLPGAL